MFVVGESSSDYACLLRAFSQIWFLTEPLGLHS